MTIRTSDLKPPKPLFISTNVWKLLSTDDVNHSAVRYSHLLAVDRGGSE